jgi:hypothetical protein
MGYFTSASWKIPVFTFNLERLTRRWENHVLATAGCPKPGEKRKCLPRPEVCIRVLSAKSSFHRLPEAPVKPGRPAAGPQGSSSLAQTWRCKAAFSVLPRTASAYQKPERAFTWGQALETVANGKRAQLLRDRRFITRQRKGAIILK